MSCILTIEQLVAYLDGVADSEVINHIQRCRSCQQKAGELERAQQRFTAKLLGHSCPSAMELGEYHLRTLPGHEEKRIRSHLRQCRMCYSKLNQLQRFVDYDPIFTQRSGALPPIILYPCIAAIKSGYSANAAISVRGREENEDFTYKIEESEINIQIQDSHTGLGYRTIWGLIIGLEANGILSAELKLLGQSQVIAISEVDAGMFTIEDILPGDYDLFLNRAESAILLRDLSV